MTTSFPAAPPECVPGPPRRCERVRHAHGFRRVRDFLAPDHDRRRLAHRRQRAGDDVGSGRDVDLRRSQRDVGGSLRRDVGGADQGRHRRRARRPVANPAEEPHHDGDRGSDGLGDGSANNRRDRGSVYRAGRRAQRGGPHGASDRRAVVGADAGADDGAIERVVGLGDPGTESGKPHGDANRRPFHGDGRRAHDG